MNRLVYLLICVFIVLSAFLPFACSKASLPSSSSSTATSAPSFTPTPTITPILPHLTPGPSACGGTDNTSGYPASGSVSLTFPCECFVPLCNGWIFLGNKTANQIWNYNAVKGSLDQIYQLSASPNVMAYDPAYSFLYVGMDGATELAKINLNNGTVTNIPIPYPAGYLSIGPAGKVFVGYAFSFSAPQGEDISLVDGVANSTVTTYNFQVLASQYLESVQPGYDAANDVLMVPSVGWSTGAVYSFSFNSSTDALTSSQSVSLNNYLNGLAVSPNGSHAMVEAGGSFADVSPANLNSVSAYYPGGVSLQCGDFSPDSQYFVTCPVGSSTLYVYNTSTYGTTKTVTLPDPATWVGFSRGGGIIYALTSQTFNAYLTTAYTVNYINWYLNP